MKEYKKKFGRGKTRRGRMEEWNQKRRKEAGRKGKVLIREED